MSEVGGVGAAEGAGFAEAEAVGEFTDGFGAMAEAVAGEVHADFGEDGFGGLSSGLEEEAAEVGGGQADGAGEFGERGGFVDAFDVEAAGFFDALFGAGIGVGPERGGGGTEGDEGEIEEGLFELDDGGGGVFLEEGFGAAGAADEGLCLAGGDGQGEDGVPGEEGFEEGVEVGVMKDGDFAAAAGGVLPAVDIVFGVDPEAGGGRGGGGGFGAVIPGMGGAGGDELEFGPAAVLGIHGICSVEAGAGIDVVEHGRFFDS